MSSSFLRKLTIITIAITALSACKKDEETTVETENYNGYFVVNEGGFGKSNASIGLYKPGDKTYFDAFKKANGRPLGDVAQSMSLIDGKYYVVVNNSNKIEVLNQSDFKVVSTITTSSPRYVLKVDVEKAYVTNFSSNTVKVLNTKTNVVTGQIDIHHSSDHQVLMDGKVYVTTFENKIMVIDVETNTLIDSIQTGVGLNKLVNIGSSKIAAFCLGSVDWNTGNVIDNGSISFISSDSAVILNTTNLTTGSYGGSIIYSSASQLLYFTFGDNVVYRLSDVGLNLNTFITLDPSNAIYGISLSASTGEIFLCDAGDFNSAGKVFVYHFSGTKRDEFSAGIAPNAVVFNN